MSTRLNWRLILSVASLGLVFAFLTIFAWLPDKSSTFIAGWALVGTIGLAVGLGAPVRPFRHGLLAGFLAGLVAVETQALFLATFFSNNPQYADIEIPFGWPPRVATAVLGPVNAVVAGLITGALAWVIWKLRRAGAGPA